MPFEEEDCGARPSRPNRAAWTPFPIRPRRGIAVRKAAGTYRWLKPPVLRHPAWAVAAVLLIRFNLRPSITTVALFLGDIKRDLGVSVFGISVLAMLPVVCLGLFAPAAPALARRFGVETVLFVSLLGIVIGSVVRSFGVAPLYLGTVIIGACLCFLGVLSPAVVKRDFPRHIGLMMGFYTMLVCVGPALSAATAVPFQHVLGGNWELVLVIWGLPALVGALAVLPRLFAHDADIRVATPHVLDLLDSSAIRSPGRSRPISDSSARSLMRCSTGVRACCRRAGSTRRKAD